jgi:hypothetical protein
MMNESRLNELDIEIAVRIYGKKDGVDFGNFPIHSPLPYPAPTFDDPFAKCERCGERIKFDVRGPGATPIFVTSEPCSVLPPPYSRDLGLATKLHADLQARGYRLEMNKSGTERTITVYTPKGNELITDQGRGETLAFAISEALVGAVWMDAMFAMVV